MKSDEPNSVDYIVVGCGIAGLRAAIELGQALSDSATEWAQGGIAAALSDEDQISLHEQDTLQAGDGLCNAAAVKLLVEEAPKYIQELIGWGTEFDRAGTKLAFTREGAHSRSRILHAQGDSTGHEISRALFARARSMQRIHIRAHAFTTELVEAEGRIAGLRYLDETTNSLHEVRAGAVLLATGGLGQVYRETTNPPVATGDGMAIAHEAGATLSDLEFVQFHPTALAMKGAPPFLLSEALRGEGAVLRNVDLDRFMRRYHEAGELAPRDVVARAIVAEMQRTETDYVYLDMTARKADYVRKRFPRIFSTCQSYGLDISSDLVPVRPAAHYAMGGIKTDLWGRTSLAGLYAAGETAATGVHGANRLASNSLLEGMVFGARAGAAMVEDTRPAQKKRAAGNPGHEGRPARNNTACRAKSAANNPGPSNPGNHSEPAGPASPILEQIRMIMWKDVGILRNGRDLALAIEQLGTLEVARPEMPSRQSCELYNVRRLAQLIARSALAREESRGSHYRSDFPYHNDEDFRKHSLIARGKKVCFE
ncbi:MAG: L-aspartate oxidase [Acidobacteria bacterium]|nr:MAG: L-aspartate oxidase [Acidobacteriota bacterium]